MNSQSSNGRETCSTYTLHSSSRVHAGVKVGVKVGAVNLGRRGRPLLLVHNKMLPLALVLLLSLTTFMTPTKYIHGFSIVSNPTKTSSASSSSSITPSFSFACKSSTRLSASTTTITTAPIASSTSSSSTSTSSKTTMPSQIKNNIIAFDETLVNVKNGTKEVAFLPKDEAHHHHQQQRHQIIKSKEGLSPITSKKPFFADEIRPIATLTPPTPPTASTSTPSTPSTASTASSSTSTSTSSSSSSSSTTTLQKYQQQSKPIVTSFQPKVYNPHPLLTNEHLQTILGVFIRDEPECAYIPTTNTATATANLNQKHQPTSTSNNTNNSNYNKNDDDTTIATKATKIIQTMRELFPIAKAVISKLPTILGLEDKDTPSPESTCMYWDKRERIDTPDGDFFHVDYKFANINNDDDDDDESDSTISNIYTGGTDTTDTTGSNSKGMVVIVHGLESNSNSTVCINMARSFHSHDFDVACMNFRGCSGVPNDTIYQYHGGFTDDLKLLIQHLSSSSSSDTSNTSLQKKQPMYISGFSLGANIVMKCLGELSTNAVSDHNIRGAAVTAAPFHLRPHHRRLIDEPIQRTLYAGSILKSMKSKIDNLVETYCDGNYDTDKFDYWMVKNATTIAEVEDGMIAPLYGFKDKFDYFEQSSSIAVVDDIAVPTFVLNAADDPFFSTTFFPWDKDCEVGDGVAPVKLVRTAHGGHLGHLFHQVDSEEYYDNEPPVASFALSELGRFINHVHTRTFTTNR